MAGFGVYLEGRGTGEEAALDLKKEVERKEKLTSKTLDEKEGYATPVHHRHEGGGEDPRLLRPEASKRQAA